MLRPTAKIIIRKNDPDGLNLLVKVIWSGANIDRPEGCGYAFEDRPRYRALAQRLKQAINDGVVHRNPVIKRDIHGRTYVSSDCQVIGRYINSDLERLGY